MTPHEVEELRSRIRRDGWDSGWANGAALQPQRTAASRWHYMLEGPGWVSIRLFSDLLATTVAVVLALLVLRDGDGAVPSTLFGFPFVVAAALYLRGMYRRRLREVLLDPVAPVAGAVSVAAMTVLAAALFAFHDPQVAPAIGRIWFITVVLVGSGRTGLTLVQRRARATLGGGRTTLIVGSGVVGAKVARRLHEQPGYGLRPVGFLDADPPMHAEHEGPLPPVLGSPDELEQVVAETGAEHVILAFSSAPDHGLVPLVRHCDELGVEVSLVPRLFESITDRVALERLGGLPLLGLRTVDPKGWQFKIKYALDKPAALVMLAAVAPLMLVAAIAVKLSSPGPVFYRQRRVGRDNRPFDLLKFRSMRPLRSRTVSFEPSAGQAPGGVEGSDRRTAVGRLLRRTAVDELPQLINVLKGEMSLVGPRPERPEYVRLFELNHDRYGDRHRVKSGITGWAQVHGLRGQTSLADRIEWDNTYIENWSLWLDFKILLMTAGAVLQSGDDA